jgi:hypothetical protein
MKVRHTGKENRWINKNEECYVVEILSRINGETEYRLFGSKEPTTPAYFNSSEFEVIDGKIPKNWVVEQIEDTMFFIPAKFKEIGFWERYFDGVPDALKIFEEEYKIIKE